jgi:uncharacterized membrane protein YkvA (DUF1232 family)
MGKLSAFAALWQAIRGQRRPDAPSIMEQLIAFPRMVTATLRGTYPGMDKTRLLMMAGALAYIISPLDLVPEGLFMVLGLGDDAVVLSWLAGAELAETEAFLAWEADEASPASATTPGVVPGEVI